ncbi:MAG: GerMN domain-containing protein [Acidimicrobiia bacterium]|nr:GerMN domain-containing protein [Acidimicrobiia bacterium]
MSHHLRWPLALVVVASVSACALPTDDQAQIVTNPEVVEVVNPTTTTSTTTRGATTNRRLYFILDDLLVAAERPLDSSLALHEILNTLASETALDESGNDELLNTVPPAVPPDVLIERTELADDGTLRIHLSDDTLLRVPGSDRTRAVAQIVVTAMGLDDDIDAVRFFIDDEPQSVPAGPEVADKSDPVDQCDYAQFLRIQDLGRFDCPLGPPSTRS